MSRDDSVLYTGSSSASFGSPKDREVKAKRAEKNQDKQDKRTTLKPHAQIISEQFNHEIFKLIHEPYENEDQMEDIEFRTERRARRLAIERLTVVRNHLLNILREPKSPMKADDLRE